MRSVEDEIDSDLHIFLNSEIKEKTQDVFFFFRGRKLERERESIHHKQAEFLAVSLTTASENDHRLHQSSLLSSMSEAQPPPPPLTQTGLLMKRGKLLWRALLISNFALGAYIFSRPKKTDGTEIHTRKGRKLQKDKTTVEVPEPPTTTTSMDSIFDDDALYFPVSIPEEVRAPITNEQQREIFKWMLEEKRKLRPKDPVEKKQIDEDKAILKQILCADTMPKF